MSQTFQFELENSPTSTKDIQQDWYEHTGMVWRESARHACTLTSARFNVQHWNTIRTILINYQTTSHLIETFFRTIFQMPCLFLAVLVDIVSPYDFKINTFSCMASAPPKTKTKIDKLRTTTKSIHSFQSECMNWSALLDCARPACKRVNAVHWIFGSGCSLQCVPAVYMLSSTWRD